MRSRRPTFVPFSDLFSSSFFTTGGAVVAFAASLAAARDEITVEYGKLLRCSPFSVSVGFSCFCGGCLSLSSVC